MVNSRYVAIDFETANGHRSSACSIGLAKYVDGELIEKFYSLIKPPPAHSEFHPINVSIHGIHEKDVQNAPNFGKVWDEVLNFIGRDPIIAHNASFDMSVIRYSLNEYGLEWPELNYLCTMVIGRASISLPTYQLSYLASGLGISWDENAHHDSLYDAIKCGEVFNALMEMNETSEIDSLLRKISIEWGIQTSHGWSACRSWMGSPSIFEPKPKVRDISVNHEADESHLFFGKHIVFTGTLYSMSRTDAWKRIAELGAFPSDGVTRETDYLVFGQQDILKLRAGDTTSSKYQKAEQMKAKGLPIEILTENDFFAMLDPQTGSKLQT